jgi:hypothetical protein
MPPLKILASPLSSGRAESGVKLQLDLDSWGTFITEAIRTENTATGGARQGVKVGLNRTLNKYLSMEFGGTFIRRNCIACDRFEL